MAETALCRYHCPNCQVELEQEGYVVIDARDEELTQNLLANQINIIICPECETTGRLPVPVVYHDGDNDLLIVYLPGAGQMTAEEMTQSIEFPYRVAVTRATEQKGIELPEPDEAAFPRGEEDKAKLPGARFAALTLEQASALLPHYLLNPTIVDNMEVVVAVVQAVREGMSVREVVDDMSRLQLINGIISSPDPITRRKVLHHGEPYLNEQLFEVLDTLRDQMAAEGNQEMSQKLIWVREEIERYKKNQQERLAKSQLKPKNLKPPVDASNKGEK